MLPEPVQVLTRFTDQDQVTSTGWGWVGLTIQGQYQDNAEKELRVAVGKVSYRYSLFVTGW